jgi:hypothetical protein
MWCGYRQVDPREIIPALSRLFGPVAPCRRFEFTHQCRHSRQIAIRKSICTATYKAVPAGKRRAGIVKLFARFRGRASNRFVTTHGRFTETSRCSERRRLRNRVPFAPAPAHHRAIVGRRQRMAAGTKLVADRAEHGTEARSVPQALESLQTSLTLPDGLVRVLDAVVLAPAAKMGDARHHHDLRRRVARSRSVTMAHGTIPCPFKSLRKKRFAARALRRR